MVPSSARLRCAGIASALALFSLPTAVHAQPGLLDDRRITITSPKDVDTKRRELIHFIWGPGGMPAGRLPAVLKNDTSPVRGLKGLERVDTLTISMEAAQKSYAHHFIPKWKNNRLVVLHHGHAPSFDDDPGPTDAGTGLQRTIDALLTDGYSVLAVYMPHIVRFNTRLKVNDVGSISHDNMFRAIKVKEGSVMKFFLEPVAVCLHYLKTRSAADGFPAYRDFSMVGLSGGGWTTTVYAAIDPTIKLSFPVAGSIPLYLRSGGSVGDTEQTLRSFYQIAGYPDLYVLGSHGPRRKQVQILNRRDDCCFGERQHRGKVSYDDAMRDYELRVRLALVKLGARGSFRLEIDEAAPAHTISRNAIFNTILAELNGGRPYVGAAPGAGAFVRGMNGHLWHNGPDGWKDTGLPMVGVPAVVKGAINPIDVIYRNPSNQLMHAYPNPAGWKSQPLRGVIITDPAAVSTAKGTIDVITFGGDYQLYHHRLTGKGVSPFKRVTGGKPGLGAPALVSRGPNQLSIFYRGFDRGLYHVSSTGGAPPWKGEALGGALFDFPTAVALPDGSLRAYARGPGSKLFEAAQANKDGPWRWASISDATGGQLIAGSPSAAARGPIVSVHARAPAGLLTFTLVKTWAVVNHGVRITGSPTAIPGGALARGPDGGLLVQERGVSRKRGGLFD
jgi:hypothetical protein